MPHRTGVTRRGWKDRVLSLLLAAVLLAGMAPGLTLPSSAHWADKYLDQLVDWGVMRADQTGDPDAPITRAEFMAIINRAYGYTKTGPIPFTDVSRSDWFYDDVAIAYNAGYMAGTSATTAHPNLQLTREMAVCILARNLMMESTPGEDLSFSDSREVSSWARGLVKTAVDSYIVSGYPDGSFGPQDPVSKGQMAALITQCVGSPLNKPGDYSLGDVFGNVTITSSGATLRNTTISGDLYVSGGVGLGDVKLENVNVLGRIIVSGTGESEQGDASVVLRNVTANDMLVDNMKDQLVTLRAEGLTNIGQTVVRTPAYLEDNTPDDYGLRKIDMQETGGRLTLAGRIKDVVNTAPRSTIQVAKGTVAKLTVDEDAVGSAVQLDRNTEAKELNLDTGANVTGQGDVDKMNVNASGVTSTMLPDNIYIRPGLEANINGEVMDSAAAEESSLDPRILSGYPKASDVAPTSLKAEFAGNKRGTIYWAVSSITDGSVTAEDLISPPSYGSRALKNGSVAVPSSNTVVPVQITGLTVGGSYYLSAVLVDARGERSPVKVISFTTPDNTKPAFAQGYPYMSLVTDTLAQATVMATKSCKLYYAVLPQGAQAPTTNDLRSAAVTGNLGYGVMDVVKNTEHTFTVSRQLEELKNYVAYFWLTDADGANSSNIVSLRFATEDATPPEFDPDPYMATDPTATAVRLTAGLNEAGTIYWVVVAQGARYPLPNGQNEADNTTNAAGESVANLESDFAKLQVKNGRNALKRGQVAVRNADTDVTINITGLERGKAYDMYYVAQDTAGNFSKTVKMISIHTLDDVPPTVRQFFDPHGGDSVREPLTTSSMFVVFSEDVVSSAGAGNARSLLDIRTDMGSSDAATVAKAEEDLADFLEKSIYVYQSESGKRPERITTWDGKGTVPGIPWINYKNARFASSSGLKAGEVAIEFPYDADPAKSAHRLASGATYYLEIRSVTDSSASYNSIKDSRGENTSTLNWENMGTAHNIPAFTTVFAQVTLSNPAMGSDRPIFNGRSTEDKNPLTLNGAQYANMDMTFRMVPGSTEAVDKSNSYDMALFTNTNLAFDLYCRITDPDDTRLTTAAQAKGVGITTKGDADTNNWFYIGNSDKLIRPAGNDESNWRGKSLGDMEGLDDFPMVSELKQDYTYDFAITVTSINEDTERATWTSRVIFDVYVLAGNPRNLSSLAGNLTVNNMKAETDRSLALGGLVSIGSNPTAGTKFVEVEWTFQDTRTPKFMVNYPSISAFADNAEVKYQLDRDGYLYYAVAPYNGIGVGINGSSLSGEDLWKVLPKQGQNKMDNGELTEIYQDASGTDITLTRPTAGSIMDERTYPNYKPEPLPIVYPGGYEEKTITLSNLEPRTKYIIYFVLKGESDDTSQVFGYAFETSDTAKPKFDLTSDAASGTANVATQIPARFWWRVFSTADAQAMDQLKATIDISDYTGTAGETMTVLEAMNTSYRYTDDQGTPKKGTAGDTDFSLFDMYGSNTQKDAVNELIRNYTGGQTVNEGPTTGTTTAGSGTRYTHGLTQNDLNKLDPYPSVYVLLVVGHHTGSDESRPSHDIDSFRAITNLQKSDLSVPYLTRFTATKATATTVGSETQYKAHLTLTFSRELYWVPSGGSAASVIPVIQNTGNYDSTKKYIGIDGNHAPSAGVTVTANPTTGSTTKPAALFTYELDATMPVDTYVRLLANGSIANVNGINNGTNADTLEIVVMPANTLINKQSGIENVSPEYVAFWNGELVSGTYSLKTAP